MSEHRGENASVDARRTAGGWAAGRGRGASSFSIPEPPKDPASPPALSFQAPSPKESRDFTRAGTEMTRGEAATSSERLLSVPSRREPVAQSLTTTEGHRLLGTALSEQRSSEELAGSSGCGGDNTATSV